MEPETDFLKKSKTKFPKELHHVLDEIGHSCPASCRVRKLGSYVVDSVYSLAGAERAFDFVSVPDGLLHLPVVFRRPFFLRRSAERLAVCVYLIFLQKFPVIGVHVYLVGKNGCRKVSETFLEQFDVQCHVGALVVGIPAVVVDKGISLIDARAYLGSELCLRLCLSADYRPYVRLEDADDAVCPRMGAVCKHLRLLLVHAESGIEDALLTVRKKSLAALVVNEHTHDEPQLLAKAGQHVGKDLADEPASSLLHLNKQEICTPCVLISRMWLADVQRFTDLPYVLVHAPATVIDNVDVDRITHLRIGASGIHT